LLLCATAFARQSEATNFSLAAVTVHGASIEADDASEHEEDEEVSGSGLTSQQRKLILNLHNKYRCMHGAGKVTWSQSLAAGAERWIWDKVFMEHEDTYNLPPPYGPAGENLASTSHGPINVKKAIVSWYKECNLCSGGPCDKFSDGCPEGRASHDMVGHFTALAWKGVKKIGCSLNKHKTVLSCRYWGGNEADDKRPNSIGYHQKHVKRRVKTEAQCRGAKSGKGKGKGKKRGTGKKGKGKDKKKGRGKKGKGKGEKKGKGKR